MKKIIIFVAVVLLSSAAMAQDGAEKNVEKKGGLLQQAAQQMLLCPSYSVEEFSKFLEENENVIIVDVRTPKEFSEGHLKGAVNVTWGNLFDGELQKVKLDPSKTLAIYCRSGKRSKMAARRLIEKGYKVVELRDGIRGWQNAEKPVEK